jgi:WASH complex subunit strumpellin
MSEELERRFKILKNKVTGLKRSIEYIQDFLNVYGEKLWNEELTRIIELAVEKEATQLVNKKYSTSMIESQENYFVPQFKPVDPFDFTFMGRVLRHISDTINRGIYLDSTNSWYDVNGNQLFGLRYVYYL